jgi:hypothetical protein
VTLLEVDVGDAGVGAHHLVLDHHVGHVGRRQPERGRVGAQVVDSDVGGVGGGGGLGAGVGAGLDEQRDERGERDRATEDPADGHRFSPRTARTFDPLPTGPVELRAPDRHVQPFVLLSVRSGALNVLSARSRHRRSRTPTTWRTG